MCVANNNTHCLMPLFDADNRLRSDLCATNARDSRNLSLEEYVFRDLRTTHACPVGLSQEDCSDLQSRIQSGDGFGVTADVIDSDSLLRRPLGGITHDHTRQTLCTRVFVSVPDMGRGGLNANIESKLLLSGDSGTSRACAHRFAELSYNRFHPGVQHVAVDNIVLPFPAGEPSRDISRSDAFLESRGYRRDKKSMAGMQAHRQ